jgi:hypothetical protein
VSWWATLPFPTSLPCSLHHSDPLPLTLPLVWSTLFTPYSYRVTRSPPFPYSHTNFSILSLFFCPEDRGSTFLRNIANYHPSYTPSYPRRQQSSRSSKWTPHIGLVHKFVRFCLRRHFPNKNCMLAMCNTPFYSFRLPLSNLFGIFRFELMVRNFQEQNYGVSRFSTTKHKPGPVSSSPLLRIHFRKTHLNSILLSASWSTIKGVSPPKLCMCSLSLLY